MATNSNNAGWGCLAVILGTIGWSNFLIQFTSALIHGGLEDIRLEFGDGIFMCIVIVIYGMFILGLIYLWAWTMLSTRFIDWFFDKFLK